MGKFPTLFIGRSVTFEVVLEAGAVLVILLFGSGVIIVEVYGGLGLEALETLV